MGIGHEGDFVWRDFVLDHNIDNTTVGNNLF